MQSEIRDSQKRALFDRVRKQDYKHYLSALTLRNIRGFREATVRFDFPVTAIIGTNGGGKTTVLGAAASIYSGVQPRRFFAKSGKFDASMRGWSIEYDAVDRTTGRSGGTVRRTANFKDQRWRRDALDREVLVFGVSRTVPANERKELQQCATNKFSVPPSKIETLSEDVVRAVGRILGTDVSKFRRARVGRSGDITLLAGETSGGIGYSEFHFGAGEASVIRIVAAIETAPDYSLILIEEIENGLHPVATVRMVDYLMEVAERKSVQALFTTHSNEALRFLPSEAIWAATRDTVTQGKLSVEALRAVVGEVDARLAVFVEDEFAASWVRASLAVDGTLDPEEVEVYPMEGDGTAVAMNRYHNQNPAVSTQSVCVLDGDSEQQTSETDLVYRLPGAVPETAVFEGVRDRFGACGSVLTLRLQKRYEDTDHVRGILDQVAKTNHDPHLLFAQVGKALGFVPESTVIGAFTTTWAEEYEGERIAIVTPIQALLRPM